jgi:hypothetical protein
MSQAPNHRPVALQLAVQMVGYGTRTNVGERYDAAMELSARFEAYLAEGDHPSPAAPAQAVAA